MHIPAQSLLDFFAYEACGVHAPDMHAVFVAIGAQLHPHQIRQRYHQEILAVYPGANRANAGMGFQLCRLDLLAGEKQMHSVAGAIRLAVKQHIQACGVTEAEAMFFRNGDNARQILPADHDVNVTSERRVRGICVLNMEEYGKPPNKFVLYTRLLQWQRQLLEGADQFE